MFKSNCVAGGEPQKFKQGTKKGMNGVQLPNGHHTITSLASASVPIETQAEPTASGSTSGYGSPSEDYHPAENGINGHTHVQLVYRDHKTFYIVRRVFFKILSDSNMDGDVVRVFRVSEQTISRIQGASVIRRASDFTVEYILSSEHTLASLIQEFVSQNWSIGPANVQSEYRRVVDNTFNDKVNWGRVISFLRFAVAYAIYVHNQGMSAAVQSIEAWTIQVVQEDLGPFFTENGGWVSPV